VLRDKQVGQARAFWGGGNGRYASISSVMCPDDLRARQHGNRDPSPCARGCRASWPRHRVISMQTNSLRYSSGEAFRSRLRSRSLLRALIALGRLDV
jgi:hypothetical protein